MVASPRSRKRRKTEHLQIRVTPAEKAAIQSLAVRAGMDVSGWVLQQALPPVELEFQELCRLLAASQGRATFVLAAMNDLLSALPGRELARAVEHPPAVAMPEFELAYVAAMVEQVCALRDVPPPEWTARIGPLALPWFASELRSLRLHLLTASPPPFRRRNIFLDTAIGGRV